jgi:t-SNARE complex subunit (syntaxin)
VGDSPEIRDLLVEIRDNQRLSLQRQEEHLAVAREQIERSRKQVDESIALQRQAIARVKRISRIAVPGIVLCVALIVYLMVRYL